MYQIFIDYFAPTIALTFAGFVTYLVKLVTAYIKAETLNVKDESLRRALEGAMAELDNISKVAVGAVQQELVSGLKKKRKFTKESAKKAFDSAKVAVDSKLSPTSKNLIKSNFDDLDDLIKLHIEKAVADNKK